MVSPLVNPELKAQFAAQGATAFSMDMLLRTLSRGQAFDVLSSQANMAGYRAVIEAGKRQMSVLKMNTFLYGDSNWWQLDKSIKTEPKTNKIAYRFFFCIISLTIIYYLFLSLLLLFSFFSLQIQVTFYNVHLLVNPLLLVKSHLLVSWLLVLVSLVLLLFKLLKI